MVNSSTTTPASSPAGASAGSFGFLGAMTPFFLIILASYFLLIRPQRKREAQKRSMIEALKRGNVVVTTGGIIGSVHKIMKNGEISMEVAEGVRLKVLKASIADVLAKNADSRPESQEDDDTETTADENKSIKNLPHENKAHENLFHENNVPEKNPQKKNVLKNTLKNTSKKNPQGKSSLQAKK
ncbi:MAG: preprotein translocase subunit YajC [Holosporaceae bacterium]|jgi:preprotein translocase subunit YajC|nr:preprotein translocase subunit YajC [Holosporaceae bacterium]